MNWHVAQTRRLVAERFGGKQFQLARPSIQSVIDRQAFARYHYHEAKELIRRYIETNLADTSMVDVVFGADENGAQLFNIEITKVAAHLTACVQSIHSIADILANCVYLSLGLNLTGDPIPEDKISCRTVATQLKRSDPSDDIAFILDEFSTDHDISLIAALANHSKHRSIIKPALQELILGESANRHKVTFQAFYYRNKYYPEIEIRPCLEPAFNKTSAHVVHVGNAINSRLLSAAP